MTHTGQNIICLCNYNRFLKSESSHRNTEILYIYIIWILLPIYLNKLIWLIIIFAVSFVFCQPRSQINYASLTYCNISKQHHVWTSYHLFHNATENNRLQQQMPITYLRFLWFVFILFTWVKLSLSKWWIGRLCQLIAPNMTLFC